MAAKQRDNQDRIMWQNQSHLTQKYFDDLGIKPDLWDVCLATDLLVEYIKTGRSNEDLKRSFENLQKYLETKYIGNEPQTK